MLVHVNTKDSDNAGQRVIGKRVCDLAITLAVPTTTCSEFKSLTKLLQNYNLTDVFVSRCIIFKTSVDIISNILRPLLSIIS